MKIYSAVGDGLTCAAILILVFGPMNTNAMASGGVIETTTVYGYSITPSGGSFFATFGGINFAPNIGLFNFRELHVDVGGGNKRDRTNDAPTEFSEEEREAIDATINAAIDLARKKKNFTMVAALTKLSNALKAGSLSYDAIAADTENEVSDAAVGIAAGLIGEALVKVLKLGSKSALFGGIAGALAAQAVELAAHYAWQQWMLSIARLDTHIRQNTNLRGTLTDNLGCMAMRQGSRGGRIQCY